MAREWLRLNSLEDLAAVLLSHREITLEGCWEWTRTRNPDTGYGLQWWRPKQRPIGVHRLAAMLWLDYDLDSKLYACHHCDNPPCFNPEHLFIGTNSENIIDARNKGRLSPARGEEKPHSKLTDALVRAMRTDHATTGESFFSLGRRYGVSDETARRACQRRSWRHVA